MREVLDKILTAAERLGADQTEAYASRNRLTTIRMATSQVIEAKNISTEGASVRLVKGGSIGFASTNDLVDRSMAKMVRTAYKVARSKKADKDFKSLPEPRKADGQGPEFDPSIENISLEEAVQYGKDAVSAAQDVDPALDVSGAVNVVVEECFVKNSLGIDESDKNSFVFSAITVEKGEQVSSESQSSTRFLKDFNPRRSGEEAAGKATRTAEPRAIKPGKYDLILAPRAVAELMEYVLSYAFDLSSIDSGISYFCGRLGEEIASPDFTITDDGRHPVGIASKKVDDEGVPTGKTRVIDHGVLKAFIADSYYANKLSNPVKALASTGNGFRFSAVPGRDYASMPHVQSTNLVVEAGDRSLEELVKGTEKGILIGRIWYTYPISPTIGEFSTTNRGDTFYVENGEIAYPIRPNSFRINDNIQSLLKNIVGIGKEQVQSVVWAGISACITPHIKFSGVNITYSKE